jgi:hypothetical protein
MQKILLICLLFGFGALQRVPQNNRQFTFINNCAQDLYIGAQGDPLPVQGGFKLQAGQTLAFSIPGNTKAARFWPRTGCRLDANGRLSCETGDCPLPPAGYTASNDGTHCVVGDSQVGGNPPATIAEFTLGGDGPLANFPDFYDLSLVDGFNIPIEITPLSGSDVQGAGRFSCTSSACKAFDCSKVPPELQIKNSNGDVIACTSICIAVNNATQRALHPNTLGAIWTGTDPVMGHPMKNLVCCTCGDGNGGCDNPSCEYGCSPWNGPSPLERGGKCNVNTWPVGSDGQKYQETYSSQCPDAYSWQFDDHQSTFQCIAPDYKISFCPPLEAKVLVGTPASVPREFSPVDSGAEELYSTTLFIVLAIILHYVM